MIAKDIGRGHSYRTLRLIYVEDGAKEDPRTNERFPNWMVYSQGAIRQIRKSLKAGLGEVGKDNGFE